MMMLVTEQLGYLSLQHLIVGSYGVYFGYLLIHNFTHMQILVLEFIVLFGLTYDEIFHNYFQIGLHRGIAIHMSFETKRNRIFYKLGRFIFIRKNWMTYPSRIVWYLNMGYHVGCCSHS